ncbi:MAG TPA: VOC family protein, partial [Methylomirabilota bacterium]|nr:VOC family protein [Methylomirabilota bacterium]
EPANQFYGDRHGGVKDASGNIWWIATHVEDVPPDEMTRRAEAFMKKPTTG